MKEFHCLKWFTGEAQTGGDMVFHFICEAIAKVRKTVVEVHPLEFLPGDMTNTRVIKMSSILIRNLISLKKVSSGLNVYSGLRSGTFEYVQPPPVDMRKLKILEDKITARLETLSRFDKTNLNLVVYASNFSLNKFRINGVRHEFIVNPPYYNSYENDLSEKKDISLTISRIHPSKKLELIGELSTKVPIKFVILGYLDKSALNYFYWLKNTYPALEILPNASEEVKRRYLYTSKIYVHSGLGEAFPISKLEAMNAGCIPLVPKIGGAKEGLPISSVYLDSKDLEEKINTNITSYDKTVGRQFIEESHKFSMNNFMDKISYYVDNYMD